MLICIFDNSTENGEQKTPLMKAIDAGHTAVVKRLLAAGARLDTADVWGTTPLIAAVFTGKPEIAKLLIQSGCDVDECMPSDCQFTPLRASLRHPPHVTLMLVIAGCRVESDVRDYFAAQIQLPVSEHTVIFQRLHDAASQPTPLAIQCRYFVRRVLGFFRVHAEPPDVSDDEGRPTLQVVDKLDSLHESGVPRRVCDFIMCRELDQVLLTFPYKQ